MIIHTNQKSKFKKRKPNAKQRELAREWEELLKRYESKKSINVSGGVKSYSPPKSLVPPGRDTPKYPSLATTFDSCTKPIHGKVYTGTLLIGIGTLHKSNAIPIISEEEAKDQASMRR